MERSWVGPTNCRRCSVCFSRCRLRPESSNIEGSCRALGRPRCFARRSRSVRAAAGGRHRVANKCRTSNSLGRQCGSCSVAGIAERAGTHSEPVDPSLLVDHRVGDSRRGSLTISPCRSQEVPTDSQAAFAFADLISRCNSKASLVIVLEDSQWIDAASAAAIDHRHTCRRSSGRSHGARASASYLDVRRACRGRRTRARRTQRRWAPVISICSLGPRPGRPWNRVEVTRLLELSGGNPLHARELVRAYPGPGEHRQEQRGHQPRGPVRRTNSDAVQPGVRGMALLALMARPDLGALLQLVGPRRRLRRRWRLPNSWG